MMNEIEKRVKEGKPLNDLYTESRPSFVQDILHIRRQYIVEKVKTPLMNGIIMMGKIGFIKKIFLAFELIKVLSRFPQITRENCNGTNANTLMDIEKKFFEYENNPMRKPLFQVAFKVYEGEIGHDEYYEGRDQFIFEEKIKAIFLGKWAPRRPGHPKSTWWKEPQPYGGEYSIVYKLWKHRDEIVKIIGGL